MPTTKLIAAEAGGKAELLADAIQARVLAGQLPAGVWLRQDRLADEFAVSRTPVREALQTLTERGIVEVHPYRGARVRRPTLRELREAYDVRAELEGFAAAQAAELATQAELDRLLAAEALFETAVAQAGGTDAEARGPWHDANDAFHEAVHAAAHNEVLGRTLADLHRRFPRNLTWGVLDDPRLLAENVAQHREVREAIERRDPDAARAVMRAHILRSGELLARRAPSDAA